MTTTVETINNLVRDFPELAPDLAEHLEDNEGELLPFVFLCDVARWAATHQTDQATRVDEMLGWLDARFNAGDDMTKDLIGVSFVEMLPASDEPGGMILNRLGPYLRQVATEMSLFR